MQDCVAMRRALAGGLRDNCCAPELGILVHMHRRVAVAIAVCVIATAWMSSSGAGGVGRSTARTRTSARCATASVFTSWSANEVRGTVSSGTLYGLLLGPARAPLHAGDELKIVWRMTGDGPLKVRFVGPDGKRHALAFGPTAHGAGSSYQRPGDEWGTGFRFTTPGCWHIRLTRSDDVGDVWFDVRRANA